MSPYSKTLNDDNTRHEDKDHFDTDESSERLSKFWVKPEQSPESTLNNQQSSEDDDCFDASYHDEPSKKSDSKEDDVSFGLTTVQDDGAHKRRRQTKMLLVSLIESFCRMHGDSPEANRKVFFLICQTLSSLGFIDSEFVDEVASVRSTFQNAFQKLLYTAVQTVRSEGFRSLEGQPRMIASTPYSEDSSSLSDNASPPPPHAPPSRHSTTSSPPNSSHNGTPPDLLFDLNIQNSRYRNDFVEIAMLGRGGFASVYRARNKLDGIEYAIKKIRLSSLETDDDQDGAYEKIFREIKHLARLEHRNVVRYYSSWLEYSGPDYFINEEEDYREEDKAYASSSVSSQDNELEEEHSNDSIFNGQDPTFEDDHSFSFRGLSEQDMSHIHFGIETPADEKMECPLSQPDSVKDASMCLPEIDRGAAKDTAETTTTATPRPEIHYNRTSERRRRKSSCSFSHGWTLYIQMYLCPATLHGYIKYRNRRCKETGERRVDSARNIEIFAQILEGTAYIHEQALIHRDLKPSNIFLAMPTGGDGYRRQHQRRFSNHWQEHGFSYDSVLTAGTLRDCMWDENWVPKIGDFGLASTILDDDKVVDQCYYPTTVFSTSGSASSCVAADQQSSMFSLSSSSSSQHCRQESTNSLSSSGGYFKPRPKLKRMPTTGVGTRTYASPEQLANPPRGYDAKVDIYSLGIILFELYQPFFTAMERANAIEQLKKGVFPEGFVEKYPKESALILWMMDENPAHRPSANQLLDFELFAPSNPTEESIYSHLQAQLQAKSVALDSKNREMAALRDEMHRIEQQNRREMDSMQRKLEELERQLHSAQISSL